MKYLLSFFLSVCSIVQIVSQENKGEGNFGVIEAPEDWGKESFELPLDFAPNVDFVGNAEIRFSPGWDDSSGPQFWTYTFAWYFDIDKKHNNKELSELLEGYFTGLSRSTANNNGLDSGNVVKATATFNHGPFSDSVHNFLGSVEFYDTFFSNKPIKLNVKAKEVYCPELKKQLIIFQFSPKPFGNDIWTIFDSVIFLNNCNSLDKLERHRIHRVKTEDYELIKPRSKIDGVLVLFPGFPENPDIIEREFPISRIATSKNIAVAFMEFNQKIWLKEEEKVQLTKVLEGMFSDNELATDNIYIGGFSSGGNISLLIGDYLSGSKSLLKPEGVFLIDSPIDILGLYENSKKNIERDMSEVSVQESTMVIDLLDSNFGRPQEGIDKYEEYSVYTTKTGNTENLSNLRGTKIRLYTEPDTTCWKNNRGYDYEEMNSYFIENLAKDLGDKGGYMVEYIATENKGYRSNGERHPHSWSIVDMDELTEWMLAQ